jgi:hypothetical protein
MREQGGSAEAHPTPSWVESSSVSMNVLRFVTAGLANHCYDSFTAKYQSFVR